MSSTVIPCLRYRDAPRMVTWICDTFDLIVDDGAGGIAHAQLTRGPGMIMLGSFRDDAFGKVQGLPEPRVRVTQSPYIVVDDADGDQE